MFVSFISAACPLKAALYVKTIGVNRVSVNRAVLIYEDAVWYLLLSGSALTLERQNDTFFHLLPREKLQAAFIMNNDMFFVFGEQNVIVFFVYKKSMS